MWFGGNFQDNMHTDAYEASCDANVVRICALTFTTHNLMLPDAAALARAFQATFFALDERAILGHPLLELLEDQYEPGEL